MMDSNRRTQKDEEADRNPLCRRTENFARQSCPRPGPTATGAFMSGKLKIDGDMGNGNESWRLFSPNMFWKPRPFSPTSRPSPRRVQAHWAEDIGGKSAPRALAAGRGKGHSAAFPAAPNTWEKYADDRKALLPKGLAVIAIDWRGNVCRID